MFPDACISIETLLSAHLVGRGGGGGEGMLKKFSGGPGGEKMAAGDGDHGYSPGTGVY